MVDVRAGRTPSHNTQEPENPAMDPKSTGVGDGSHDVMVVEIPPSTAAAEKTDTGGDSRETPPSAGKQSTIGRMDSVDIPPGTTAAVAVTGKQSTLESGDSDSTTTRQPATN